MDFALIDNALVEIADWGRARQIANGLEVKRLHQRLDDEMARRFCPIHREFGVAYHWSVDQCEYATDIVFRRQADLAAIYGNLTRTAIHTVKPDSIATFLGRKLSTEYEGEVGNRFNSRIEGTRIKHTIGPVSLKLYCPPCGKSWKPPTAAIWSSCPPSRIGATAATNSTSSHGPYKTEAGPTPDSTCSMPVMKPCSAPSHEASSTSAACRTKSCADSYPTKTAGRYPDCSSASVFTASPKRVGHSYKYYLTKFGGAVITTGLKLRELLIIPELALGSAA